MPDLQRLIRRAGALLGSPDLSVEPEAPVGLTPGEREEMQSLHHVANRVRRVMVPVGPSTAFKAALRNRISDLASGSVRREIVVAQDPRPSEWMVGALVGSAVALVGGLAYLIRARSQAR